MSKAQSSTLGTWQSWDSDPVSLALIPRSLTATLSNEQKAPCSPVVLPKAEIAEGGKSTERFHSGDGGAPGDLILSSPSGTAAYRLLLLDGLKVEPSMSPHTVLSWPLFEQYFHYSHTFRIQS